MIYNLARFNCYNDTCRGHLIFALVEKRPIKIGLIYDQRCILIAASATAVYLISPCPKNIEREKQLHRLKRKNWFIAICRGNDPTLIAM